MNNEMSISDSASDDAFDARLRACIARVEPVPPPSPRYLRRVWIAVARRAAIALVVVAIVGGGLCVRSAVQHNYKLRRLAPEWLLEIPR